MTKIKRYNKFINESLKDKLKGKSEEEVKSKLIGLGPKELLKKSAKIGYIDGVKSAIKSLFKGNIMKSILINFNKDDLDVALEFAIRNNHYEITKYLIENGANPYSEYYDNLQIAVDNDNYDMVKLLIDSGVDVNGNDQDAFTSAFFTGNYGIIKLFLDNGVDPKCKNNMPMKILSKMEFSDGPIKGLLQSYIDKKNINESLKDKIVGKSKEEIEDIYKNLPPDRLIELSVRNNNTEGVKQAIERGATIYKAALIMSVQKKYVDIVKILLENGADMSADSYQAFRDAVDHKRNDIIKLFIKNGIEPFVYDGYALTYSIMGGNIEMIKYLLSFNPSRQIVKKSMDNLGKYSHNDETKKLIYDYLDKKSPLKNFFNFN
jgi:ankyrin repeat protein